MNEELRRDIESFVSENENAIFEDIARLVSFNSENAPALPGSGRQEYLESVVNQILFS